MPGHKLRPATFEGVGREASKAHTCFGHAMLDEWGGAEECHGCEPHCRLCNYHAEAKTVLIFAKNADNSALNLQIAGRDEDQGHFGIGRLQADLAGRFAIKALQRGFAVAY